MEQRPDDLDGNYEDDFMYKIKYVCSIDPSYPERPYLIMTYVKESDSRIRFFPIKTKSKIFHVIDENEMAEVLNNIFEIEMNSKIPSTTRIQFQYNAAIGNLKIRTWYDITAQTYEGPNVENPLFHFDFGGINITESHPFHNVAAIEFLKFLNQELTLENYFKLQVLIRAMEFKNNVWNRKQAMFHASFSNCSLNEIRTPV